MITKETLQKSQHISVQLPAGAAQKDVQTASTLICGLRELGKDVRLDRKAQLATISRPSANTQDFVVSLRGLASKISKVQYEKDKEDLHLHFTLQKGRVPQEDLSLQIQNQEDLTIIVGQDNLSEKAVLELLAAQVSTQAKLLGRVLQKLEYVGTVYVSSIQQKDFQETHSTPKTLIQAAQRVQEDFGDQSSYLFVFEPKLNLTAQALLWTLKQDIRARFLRTGTAQQKGPWTLLNTTQSSPQQLRDGILT